MMNCESCNKLLSTDEYNNSLMQSSKSCDAVFKCSDCLDDTYVMQIDDRFESTLTEAAYNSLHNAGYY